MRAPQQRTVTRWHLDSMYPNGGHKHDVFPNEYVNAHTHIHTC